jgi:DNA-binding CsgD family transcriptional regulator
VGSNGDPSRPRPDGPDVLVVERCRLTGVALAAVIDSRPWTGSVRIAAHFDPADTAPADLIIDDGHLTPREREVLALIELGWSNKQIARQLCIEIRTVKNHVHNLLEKLRVSRRGEAAVWRRRINPPSVGTSPHRFGPGLAIRSGILRSARTRPRERPHLDTPAPGFRRGRRSTPYP